MTTRVRNRLIWTTAVAVVAVVLAINIAYAVVLAYDWWSRPHAGAERVDAVDGRAHAVRTGEAESAALPIIDADSPRLPHKRGKILPKDESLGKTLANGTAAAMSSDRLACIDHGWFSTRRERERARQRLQALGAQTREYEASLAGVDHLVFVHPAGSASLARQTRADLATQSITGFLEMTGPRRFAVVVGIASSHAEAVVIRDGVAGLGYDVAIESIDRSGTVFGLRAYHVPKDYAASVPHRACPDVATRSWFL